MTPLEPHQIDPAEARDLIRELDHYQNELYPPESNHLESEANLKHPNIKMFGCTMDKEIVAMGAVKFMGNYGEIKRLYVPLQYRGKGLAKAIMTKLELEIINHGLSLVRLETGIRQTEAVGLYERMGYVKRGPFGDYQEDPLSVFMEKNVALHIGDTG